MAFAGGGQDCSLDAAVPTVLCLSQGRRMQMTMTITMTLNRPTQQARSGRSSATTRLMVVQQEDRTSPGRSQTGSSPRHDKRLSPHDRPIPEDLTCRSTRQSLRQSRGSGSTPSLTQSLSRSWQPSVAPVPEQLGYTHQDRPPARQLSLLGPR